MTQPPGVSYKPSAERLVHLDMLRGLAALAVVAGHARGFVFVDYDAAGTGSGLMKVFYFVTGLGHQAVIAFFALSGFLVGGKAFEAISAGVWSFPNYLIARLSRLWTVALPALALTLCLDSLGVSLTNGAGYDGTLYGPLASGPPSGTGIDLSLTTLAGNMAFLQTIAVPTYGSNGPLWSLANELWYYVIFPLFAVAFATTPRGITRAVAATAAVAITLVLPRGLVILGTIWVAGALAYLASQRTCLASRAAHPVASLSATAAAALLIVLGRSGALALPSLVQDLMLGLAFAALLPGLASLTHGPQAYRRVASGLSEISYTLYATHFPILAVIWFAGVAPRQFAPDAASLALWGAMFLTSVLAAAVLWWCFERHTPAVRRLATRAFSMTRDAEHAPRDVASAQAFKQATVYRPEIDGLRAIAVTVVVLFHAGLPGFSGGFVGVDIFFVVSGYLITGMLVREQLDANRIDILDFYARRVRRILPAFAVVLLATLAVAQLVLTLAGEQQDLASSAAAAAAFASNIYFWRTQTGYFAGPAEQLPLLHMWTLAVEEQFYIVWPLAIILLAALARWFRAPVHRTLFAGFVLACALSLLACIVVTPLRTTMAFYLMPFRMWEFGAGALLSILLPGRSWHGAGPAIGAFATLSGLAAIIASVVMFDMNTMFPGYAALLPVAGTALILAGFAAAPRGSPVVAPFQSLPAVIIGKLSYSWYLWHWPLLALARAYALGEHDLARDLGLVALALVLSAITYVLVEQPIRERRPWPFAKRGSAVMAGAFILLAVVVSSFVLRTSADARLAASPTAFAARQAANQKFPYPAQCSHFRLPFDALAPIEGCTIGGSSPVRAVLWGDSHAFHFVPAFDSFGKQTGQAVIPRVMGDCRPYTLGATAAVSGRKLKQLDSCTRFNKSVLASLPALKEQGAEVVVLSARWSHPSEYQQEQPDWSGELKTAVARIRELGLPVVLIADVPGYAYDVPQCIARRGSEGCTKLRRDADTARLQSITVLQEIAAADSNVHLIDPIDMLCDAQTCRTMQGGTVLYSDRQHLSVAASQGTAGMIGAALARFSTTQHEQSQPQAQNQDRQ